MKLRMNRWVYFTLGAILTCAPIAIVLVQLNFPEFGAELDETILFGLGFHGLALLTYPSGILGTGVAISTIFFGPATPAEAILLGGPVAIALGYLQWFVVLPRLFGRARLAGIDNSALHKTERMESNQD